MLQTGVAVALMKSGCVRAPHSLVHALHDADAGAGLVTPNGKAQTQPERFKSPAKFLQGFSRHVVLDK